MSTSLSNVSNSTAPYLLGTAAPANVRKTRPLKTYSHPVLSHHRGGAKQYFVAKEEKAPRFPAEVVVFTQPLEPAGEKTTQPFYNRAPYSSAVLDYLSTHRGPQTETSIRSVLPADASFRDVMYRLVKSGKVERVGDGAYSLKGVN